MNFNPLISTLFKQESMRHLNKEFFIKNDYVKKVFFATSLFQEDS